MLNASCTDPLLLYSLYFCQIYAKFIYAKYDKAAKGSGKSINLNVVFAPKRRAKTELGKEQIVKDEISSPS